MNRWRQRLRGTRVTLGQLGLVSIVSAVVSAVIVVGALGETGPEKAVISALRARQVIHEAGSASAGSTAPSATPAADTTAAPSAATPAASVPPTDDSSGAAASAAPDASAADSADGSASESSDSSDGSSAADSSSGSSSSDGSSDSSSSSGNTPAANKPAGAAAKVKHVFVITVSTPSYDAAFGHGSVATYLNGTLRPKGVLLSNYRSLGSGQLPDYLAMVSGQAPNPDTDKACSTYAEFPGKASPAKDGLVPGSGCIYPNTALTVGDQLDGATLPWRGYMDGMTSACQHPNSGAADTTIPTTGAATTSTTSTTTTATTTSSATTTTGATTTGQAGSTASPSGGYETSENPFVYFHSLLDLGDCQSDDLPLTKLAGALHSTASTPHYAFIAPDPCDTGTVASCPVGKPTGIAAADAFLHQVVPGILASPAYKAGGAVVIAFTATPPAGGGGDRPARTGALVLSPHAKPGATVAATYDPYSILRTVEDVFGLTSLAKAKSAHGFDQKVFTR